MSDPIVIVGAGGHGRELLWIARAAGLGQDIAGFVDDGPTTAEANSRLNATGVPLLGSTAEIDEPHRYLLAIGSSDARRRVVERLDRLGWTPVTLTHPDAIIGDPVDLGEGTVCFPRSVITTNVSVGRHTHLNVGVVVQHDSKVGSFVTMSPGVYVNGDVTVGDDVFVGTGAILTRGITVGSGARIGAGAVVLHDVEPDALVAGIPASKR